MEVTKSTITRLNKVPVATWLMTSVQKTLVRISTGTPTSSIKHFLDFPQLLPACDGILYQLGKDRFLHHTLQFIIH
jgi:hypothetical protein